VVEQLPHHPKVEGLRQASIAGTGSEEIAKIIKIHNIYNMWGKGLKQKTVNVALNLWKFY
jgi:hypothetical protein